MKKIACSLMISVLLLAIPISTIIALVYSATITVNATSDYPEIGCIVSSNNTNLASSGYITPTGLDTRVLNGTTELPHMLVDNMTLFASSLHNGENTFSFTTGNPLLTSYDIIPGYSGNISTIDNASLELGSVFDVSISGYFDTTAGADKNILYKDGACQLYVSADSTITFVGGSGNVTLSANPVASGIHTIRIYADGLIAYLLVDGAEVDTEPLYVIDDTLIGDKGAAGTYFERNSRMSFYAAGLYWQFFFGYGSSASATCVLYQTSSNGTSWSAETYVVSDNTSATGKFSLWFDGTYVHYARIDTTPNPDAVYYRRGEPQNDGSITWSAAEQSVGIDDCNTIGRITIDVSSGGYPFIMLSDGHLANPVPHVIKSSTNDGTWSTDAGYPYGTSFAGIYPDITCFSSGNKVYYAYETGAGSVADLRGRYYNGAAWAGSEEIINATGEKLWSLISDDSDQVYCAYYDDNATTYLKVRSSGGSWGSPIEIYNAGTGTAGVSLTYDPTSNSIFVFYSHGGTTSKIYYKIYNSGVLSSESELTVSAAFNASYTRSYGRVYNGVIAVGSEVVDGGTYKVRQGRFTFPWTWVDNGNDWYWMQNNSMAYADNMTISVTGTEKLRYLPDYIISGTTLIDESGNSNDGEFHWGIMIPATMSSFIPIPSASNIAGQGTDLLPLDPIDWTDSGNAPMVKPATPNIPGVSDMVSIWSQMWSFDTDNIAWVFIAMLLCVFFFWLFAWQLEHVGYAMIVVGIIIGFFSIPAMAVIPWGGLFIAALAIISGTVVEVKA